MIAKKEHWENVYEQKLLTEVSWYEERPEASLNLIADLNLPKNSAIIDIGGGDSFLVDHLLALGYTNISVLDISAKAIERAKLRLANKAQQVEWIVSDVLDFKPAKVYDLWHDRAAFHFLTDTKDVRSYLDKVNLSLKTGTFAVIATFAEDGPEKCSGLAVRPYSEKGLGELFSMYFEKQQCFHTTHLTPFQIIQKFIYCSFTRK
ncbi:class I SAM-dependent methyltransferase [Mucilaginibacter antarcticus]|uniref:Class I SAM-dependent methyltransferase n=1 Tax=Mucilaginibacter antarcticus TaxID=1855725 RepID=A0ABW5XTM7_9SPHI